MKALKKIWEAITTPFITVYVNIETSKEMGDESWCASKDKEKA